MCEPVVDSNLLDMAIYGDVGHVGYGANERPQPPVQSFETPYWNVPVPSPSDGDYRPFSGYGVGDLQDGWDYGLSSSFEAYDPEGEDSSSSADKPPPRVQNGPTFAGDGGDWFGSSEAQWVAGRTVGRSSGNRAGVVGRTLSIAAAAALANILLT